MSLLLLFWQHIWSGGTGTWCGLREAPTEETTNSFQSKPNLSSEAQVCCPAASVLLFIGDIFLFVESSAPLFLLENRAFNALSSEKNVQIQRGF